MISKAKVKYINSLQVKKYRIQEQSFVVEGAKSVTELLKSDFVTTWVAATEDFISQQEKQLRASKAEVVTATDEQLSSLGSFQTNDAALAVARIKPNRPLSIEEGEIALVLDSIRDPGNLGTIIRTADWYGVKNIIASDETADFYNPKVLSASMGSFCRVSIQYVSLVEYLTAVRKPIYGTFLDGLDVHQLSFSAGGLIVIGNESNGISPAVERLVSQKITVPRFGKAESLNAAIATGIVLDVVRQSKK
jgi:RNA methyltransferase, TrmH family